MFRLRFRVFVMLSVCVLLLGTVAVLFAQGTTSTIADYGPYTAPSVGVPDGYRGFDGSYTYPTDPPPVVTYPWTESLNGDPINVDNAGNYISIVKEYITESMVTLLADTRADDSPIIWDAAAQGWYNEPWLSQLRDGIHGTYVGSPCMPAVLFPKSGLKNPFTTYVLVFYNDVAARSLYRVWGDNEERALSPQLLDENGLNNAQFDEGSIIVKAAFTTSTSEDWEPMTGALPWNVYSAAIDCTTGNPAASPSVFSVNFFQFDIIVKDSVAAPKTTWVFSTLNFDNRIEVSPDLSPAEAAWAQMSTLGVMWGNDPEVTDPTAPLSENWINPDAPVYATETLGWGGRLSGPNDGAVTNPPYYICTGDGCNVTNPCADASQCTFVDVGGENLAMSSCMSCHGTAQYAMPAFLLPVVSSPHPQTNGDPIPMTAGSGTNQALVYYEPASEDWMQWFQDRSGTEPQNPDNPYVIVATDYDMNLPFKVLPQWANQICIKQGNPHNDPTCNVLSSLTITNLTVTDYQGQDIPGH